ncbi:MAG: hypothetical protein AABZ30_06305 [Myxococcota bacterium]
MIDRDPPPVADVRRWRAKMVEAAGGTVEGLVAYLKRREPEHRRFMEEARAEKPRRRRARR